MRLRFVVSFVIEIVLLVQKKVKIIYYKNSTAAHTRNSRAPRFR